MSPHFIPPQSGVAFVLPAGAYLKVIDPMGEQVCDLFCFSESNPTDALSAGRSIDYEDTILFTTGNKLYSQMGLPMLEIIEDRCGRHDFLVTPCSLQMFQMIAKNNYHHHSCLENLETVLANYKVNPAQIGTTFNIFMNIRFEQNGKIKIEKPLSKAGDHILFLAKMDLIVGLTACADEGTNNGECKHIHYEIIRP